MNFVEISILTHIFAIDSMLAIMIWNLFTLSKKTNFVQIAKRLKTITPAFHGLNFAVAYTGATVAAFSHDLSITVILMIISTLSIMILEIKRYKKMRIITSNDTERQDEFIIYAKKIYMIEIGIIIFTFLIAKFF